MRGVRVLNASAGSSGDESPGGGRQDVRNELTGSVTGPAVQAGTVYGGIHITAAPAGPTGAAGPAAPVVPVVPFEHRPWQLPPVGRLADRTLELAALEDFRRRAAGLGHPTLAAVSGIGGVGKTVLALSWLHGLRDDFPDGQLYADLGAQPQDGAPVSPFEVIGRFLRALRVPADQIPHAADERTGLYRSLTATRRLVVLLDNAVTAAQVRPLVPGGPSVVVATSRWRLPGLAMDGGYLLHLEPLGTDAAVELLAMTLADDRVRAQPTDARALVELCEGLPLAVRVAGARLAARPGRGINAMVRELADEHSRLGALAIDGDHGVRATLDLAYGALPQDAARLYRLLALHPGPDFTADVAAAVLGDADRARAEPPRLLDLLHDANLLTDTGDEHYRFHDLVRLHAASRAEADEDAGERTAAERRVFDHYLATATRAEEILDPHHRSLPRDYGAGPVVVTAFGEDGDGDALAWLERELPSLMRVIRQARRSGQPTVTWQLADAMWSLFVRRKHYEEWRAAHEEGAAAARELSDTAAECRMLTSGGLGELDTGHHARALESFERAARLFDAQGDGLGFARTLNYRGLAQQGLGRLREAAALFEQAAAELPVHGDVRAGALARFNLAEVALAEGRYEAAATEAEAAHRTLTSERDPYNAARAARVSGTAHLALAHPATAEPHLLSALAALHGVSDFETAQTLEVLAELLESRGQPGPARDRYEEALALYQGLGLTTRADAVRARLDGDGETPG